MQLCMQNKAPAYLQHFEFCFFVILQGWVFNVVPWAMSIPFQWSSGLLADLLIARGCSTTFTRKFIQVPAERGNLY